MIWETFGHQSAKVLLERQLAAGKLPHAYLFAGPEGIGKRTLAADLAKKILAAGNLTGHPDFQLLEAGGGITVEAAREFIGRISLKPFAGPKAVSIINDAQNLNVQSANALLKTLEEPAPQAVIILVASGRLLPTVVSRCQVIRLCAFGRGQLAEFARRENLQAGEEILALSFGSPARLKRLAEDRGFFTNQRESIGRYRELAGQPLGRRLAAVGQLAENENLGRELADWLSWQQSALAGRPQDFARARCLAEAAADLRRNKNKKLVLQTLMIKL